MVIAIQSFDGFDLSTDTYTAYFVATNDAMGRAVTPVTLPVIGGFARDEGFDHTALTFQIAVLITGDLHPAVDELKEVFRAGRSGELVAAFEGGDRARAVRVEASFPFAGTPSRFVIAMVAADPRWHALTATEDTEEIDTDGQTWIVENAGNAIVDDAIFTITPTDQKAAADSWQKRRYIHVANRVTRPLSDWPIEVTNGGFDHAAMVSSGESLSSGADLRVIEDGKEIPRYFHEHSNHDANDDQTKIWATPKWSAGREAFLLGAITNVSPANGEGLPVGEAEIRDWPAKGYFVIPDSGEVMAYEGWSAVHHSQEHMEHGHTGHAVLHNIRRGIWGTAADSASSGAQMLLLQHKLELISGFLGAEAPASQPERKPLLNLASSTLTNIRHEWTDFFDDEHPTRPGGWTRAIEGRDKQVGKVLLADGSPAAAASFEYRAAGPTSGKPNYNIIRRAIPVGTGASSGTMMQVTRSAGSTMGAYILGTDRDGNEVVLRRERGPISANSVNIADVGPMQDVAIYAHSIVISSLPALEEGMSYPIEPHNLNSAAQQPIVIPDDAPAAMLLTGVALYVRRASGTSPPTIQVYIESDNDGPSGHIISSQQFLSGLSTSFAWHVVTFTNPAVVFPGQKVWLEFAREDSLGSNAAEAAMVGMEFEGSNGVAYLFRAFGSSPAQKEYAVGTDGDKYDVTAAVMHLDSNSTPYFAMSSEQDLYWLNGTLRNNTTEQSLRLNIFGSPDHEYRVDCAARTVTCLDTGEVYTEGHGVEVSDPDQWLSIAPGLNELQWDEPGVAGVTVVSTYRDRWE